MESVAVLSSQETWLRQHAGESQAWLLPTKNGVPRIVKPPLVVWMNMLAWVDLDPESFQTAQLIVRARLMSVLMTVVMLMGIYWIGRTLEDETLGLIAVAVAGSLQIVHSQARMATYDMHLAAWATVSVAAALWAMRPFGGAPSRGRWLVGWAMSGLGLGLAWLSKGPLAIVLVLLPLAVVLALAPHRRNRSMVGATAALLIAALIALPWYFFTAANIPHAWDSWLFEFRATGPNTQRSWSFYLVNLFRMTLPWTIWIVGGLVLPFWVRSPQQRRKRLIPSLWFLLLLVMYSCIGSKEIRYIIPVAPALSLLIAYLWWHHEALARQGNIDRGTRPLIVMHWIGLLVAALAFGPFLATQDRLAEMGLIKRMLIDPLPWSMAIAATGLLLAVTILGWRWHGQWRPKRAALATAAWTLVAATVFRHGFAHSHDPIEAVEQTSQRVVGIIGDAPFVAMRSEGYMLPRYQFLLYLRRTVRSYWPKQLNRYLAQAQGEVFVMSSNDEGAHQVMQAAGCELLFEFEDLPGKEHVLWHCDGSRPLEGD